MINLGGFFAFAITIVWIGLIIYVVMLLTRFVNAHERMADSLEKIANKPQAPDKP
ncbi:MAG TPA: hypothetical protein VL863_12265 [bacterium]|nr:hypothetical protein [bacterium]